MAQIFKVQQALQDFLSAEPQVKLSILERLE